MIRNFLCTSISFRILNQIYYQYSDINNCGRLFHGSDWNRSDAASPVCAGSLLQNSCGGLEQPITSLHPSNAAQVADA